jgi:hypothetical protein
MFDVFGLGFEAPFIGMVKPQFSLEELMQLIVSWLRSKYWRYLLKKVDQKKIFYSGIVRSKVNFIPVG